MKRSKLPAILIILAMSAGCGNFSPRANPRADNNSGRIEDIKTNQNGVMAEIGKLRQEMTTTNSKLKEIQTGVVNMNATLSRNENTGIQIIQGDGALIFVFSLIVMGMMTYYYRSRAIQSEKTTEVIAREVALFNDARLNDSVLKAAANYDRAKDVYMLLKKNL